MCVKTIQGGIHGHVCTCLAEERQEAARHGGPSAETKGWGGGRAAQHARAAWDAPSCIALMPPRELQRPGSGSASSYQCSPSPPPLLCGNEMLRWELQFPHQQDLELPPYPGTSWSVSALSPRPLERAFEYRLAPCTRNEKAAVSDVTPDTSFQGSRPS